MQASSVRRVGTKAGLSPAALQRIARARVKLRALINRPFRRQERTLFQRCLAVHIISASETSLLR